jgi:hypothetical protein
MRQWVSLQEHFGRGNATVVQFAVLAEAMD